MKIIYKIIIALFTLVIFSNTIQAQIVDICAGNEEIKLKTDNFQYGTIEWESSYDNEHWTKIEGAKDTIYTFLPSETKYYRAVNTFSECAPQYSEVSLVQMPVEANAGSDRIIPGTSLIMTGNLKGGETGTWSVISGTGSNFIDITNPYSEFVGSQNSEYSIVWEVTNACGTDKDTISIIFKENTYIEAHVVVDENDILHSTQAQLDAGEYIIEFADPVPNITDTTVLIGLINDGFLRKVNSFTQTGSTFTMQTEQSSLDKITDEGAYDVAQVFNLDTTLTDTKTSNYHKLDHMPTRAELISNSKFKTGNYYYVVKSEPVYLHPGVTMKKTKNKGGGALIDLNFNKTILSSGNVNLALNGNYTFTPNIKADLDYHRLHLNSFKMGMYNGTIERNYELALTASGTANLLDQDFTLMTLNKDIVFILGGVPVWIRAQFKIDGQISADVSASMNVTHQYNKTSTYTSAIEYEQGQWQYIYNESDNIQTNNNFTVTGDLTQTFDIGPNLTFKIYGIVGPYIDARLTEEMQLCFYNDNWNANMNIGGELSVGAKAEILGKTLFDKSKTWSQSFYNLQFPYNLEIITGNNQNYELGNSLEDNIKLRVMSNKGFGAPFALVHFEPQNGGSVENSDVFADINGYAETSWTPGANNQSTLEAYILDCEGNQINNSPLVFTANENSTNNCSQSSLSLIVVESGGAIQPLASMGIPPYEYSDDGINFNTTPPQVIPTAGENYLFFVRDNNNCYANASYNAPANVCENTNISLSLNVSGNVIEASATGGTAPYEYALDGGSFSTTNVFTAVSVGIHTIHVRDVNLCTNFASAEVYEDNEPIVANFYAEQTSVILGTQIQFYDLSNSATTWAWDFGDGSTSTQKNPAHTYSSVGNYTVSLTATNIYGSSTETKINYITVSSAGSGTVTDYDGNTYPTVIIGTQEWMAEDLKVTHYPNGDAIPLVTDNTAWGNLADNNTDDAYCFYNNNSGTDYGALYTWAAAMGDNAVSSNTNPSGVQGVCPTGWHLPSDAEWTVLTDYLGGTSVAGGKMKETGTIHWNSSNTGATNESGFTALPGGSRYYSDGTFRNVGYRGNWWSSTENSGTSAYYRILFYVNAEARRNLYYKSHGFSVRCVRD